MSPSEARKVWMRNERLIKSQEKRRLAALAEQVEAQNALIHLKQIRQRLTVDLRMEMEKEAMAKSAGVSIDTIRKMAKREMTEREMGWWEIKASR